MAQAGRPGTHLLKFLLAASLMLAGALAAPARSAERGAGQLDRMFSQEAAADRFSGAVLIGKGGRVLFAKAYGQADREWGQANSLDTRFRIASVTKSFTAALVLKLEAQGKLDVSDPVCRYIDRCPEAWQAITLHHLLTHTSGVPNLQADAVDYFRRSRLPTAPSAVVAGFRERPLDFPPGEKTLYSNTGYVILTSVIEKVAAKPYRAALAEAFFEPLGLSGMGYETAFDLVPRRARGYIVRNGVVGRADHIDMSLPAGAGSLYGTVDDLYRWSEALHRGRAIDASRFTRMSAQSGGPFGELVDNGRRVTYGYGLEIEPSRRGLQTFHYGSIDGFRSYMRRYGDDGLTVVILANLQSVDVGSLGDRAAALAAGVTVETLLAR